MIVTKTEACTRTKYRVWLDGEFAFVLYKGELSRYGIREGEEIAGATVEKIRTGSCAEKSEAVCNASAGGYGPDREQACVKSCEGRCIRKKLLKERWNMSAILRLSG